MRRDEAAGAARSVELDEVVGGAAGADRVAVRHNQVAVGCEHEAERPVQGWQDACASFWHDRASAAPRLPVSGRDSRLPLEWKLVQGVSVSDHPACRSPAGVRVSLRRITGNAGVTPQQVRDCTPAFLGELRSSKDHLR